MIQSKVVISLKLKRRVATPIIIILLIVAYAVFMRPTIENRTWVLSYAQKAELPLFVVAHNDDYNFSDIDSSFYKFSKPIDLTLEAKDGQLLLVDKTNNHTYEGTYSIKSWSRFTNQSFFININGITGTANFSSQSGRMLFVSIGDYYLHFEVD